MCCAFLNNIIMIYLNVDKGIIANIYKELRVV